MTVTTPPTDSAAAGVESGGAVWRIPPAEARRVDLSIEGTNAVDPVQALMELGDAPEPSAGGLGLADQLLAWIAPRPRNASTLTQSRIAPLLGLAADLLAQTAGASGDVVSLGATALAQELRMQRALADRRATLLKSDGP